MRETGVTLNLRTKSKTLSIGIFSLFLSLSSGEFSQKEHHLIMQLDPSSQAPGGLLAEQVPQFVMFGFDDNSSVEELKWIIDFMSERKNPSSNNQRSETFDNNPIRAAFYTNGKYLVDSVELRKTHKLAFDQGHEIGNHTHHHFHGGEFTTDEWLQEMKTCQDALMQCGIPNDALIGFRTPFLEFNTQTFIAAEQFGFHYDSTVEEGEQADQDGTNFLWPYTLHDGSPGNKYAYTEDSGKRIGSHPGLWQIPVHVFMIPSDEHCQDYGIAPGLRVKIKSQFSEEGYGSWVAEDGKITGFDWNILEMAGLNGKEFEAILKYSLDLRLKGNRAPFMIGAHSDLYPESQPDRRQAIENFIEYALSIPEVRIVTPAQLIDWMKNPVGFEESL